MTDLPWGQLLLDHAAITLTAAQSALQEAAFYACLPDGPAKYWPTLKQEIEAVGELADIARSGSWAELQAALEYSFASLSPIRKDDPVKPDLKDYCTSARDQAKKIIKNLKEDVFSRPEQELVAELGRGPDDGHLSRLGTGVTAGLKRPSELRVADFADLEHYALRILLAPESTP